MFSFLSAVYLEWLHLHCASRSIASTTFRTAFRFSVLDRSCLLVSLAFLFFWFVRGGFPLDWIFLASLSGGIVFAFVFAICTPGRLLFVYSLFPSCPADHGPERRPHFVFSRWIIIRLGPDRLMWWTHTHIHTRTSAALLVDHLTNYFRSAYMNMR